MITFSIFFFLFLSFVVGAAQPPSFANNEHRWWVRGFTMIGIVTLVFGAIAALFGLMMGGAWVFSHVLHLP